LWKIEDPSVAAQARILSPIAWPRATERLETSCPTSASNRAAKRCSTACMAAKLLDFSDGKRPRIVPANAAFATVGQW
jgi:hypothetical protein